jgi:DNA invertase Pin-like site-specific DNA recombinase
MATRAVESAQDPILCGIYARISKDDAGDMLGVRRQERDATALAVAKGWTVEEAYVDDDASAWSGRRRPAYRRMLADLEAGKINAVIAYDLDRLHRLPRELEQFFDVCDRAGVTKLATVAGDVDLGSNDGRLIARIMGAVAKKSSDDTSRRIKRRFQDDAEAGKPHGPRAFGYNEDRLTINKAEAKIVKSMVARVLAGDPLNAIARDLNERGVKGPQGGRGWAGTTVRAVVSNPRLAGLRAHHGVVVSEGQWAPIIDRATHERLVAHFAEPSRRRTSPERLNLLSGLMVCGRCGSPLFYNGPAYGTIRCIRAPGRPNCGRLSIAARPLEGLIVEAVLAVIDDQALLDATVDMDDDDAVAEIVALEARLTEAAEMFAAGEISRGEWTTVRAGIDKRLAEGRRKVNAATKARHAPTMSTIGLRKRWPKLSLADQRAILGLIIDRIEIKPAIRFGCNFDPDRVDVTWKA